VVFWTTFDILKGIAMRLSTSNIYEIGDVPVMREVTDDERSKFNTELLNYILDELIPWHVDDSSV